MENRLCSKPLAVRYLASGFEDVRSKFGAERFIQEKLTHALTRKLKETSSPCLSCQFAKTEYRHDFASDAFEAAMYCGLGKNPVCPDIGRKMRGVEDGSVVDPLDRYHDALEDRYARKQTYMNTVSPHTPITPPPPPPPKPRPRDQPVTQTGETW